MNHPGPDRRIDRAYYEQSNYFDQGTEHLTDLSCRFQRYRVEQVLGIRAPQSDDRVVDLGCGWGTFEWALAPTVREIVGVDFAQTSIDLCEQDRARRHLDHVRFVRADAGDTGLPGGAWDHVICADLYEHLYPNDSRRVTHEAFRLLRSGGHFVVWTPHRGHLIEILKNRRIVGTPDPTHVDYKSMERLKALLADAGFEIRSARWVESHLPFLNVVERAAAPWVPILRRRIAIHAVKPAA